MLLSSIGRKKRQKNLTVGLADWALIAGRALHPKSNVMRIYIKRRYGERGLISVEECCAAELRSIYFYLANSEEDLLKVVARLEK